MAGRRGLRLGYRFLADRDRQGLRACLALSAPWGGLIEGEGDEWDGYFMSRFLGAWDSVRQVRKVSGDDALSANRRRAEVLSGSQNRRMDCTG